MKINKKKYKLRKTTSVKATSSGQSPENISGETNNIQPVISEEGLRPRNILIDYDTNLKDLYQELLKESYKDNPREIRMYVVDARNFSLEVIEKISEMINKRKLKVNLDAINCIDFTGLALFGLCVTGEVYFPNNTDIHMESINPIPKNELNRISKKISERTGVEATVVSELYNQKAIVEPVNIFPDFSNANIMENYISVDMDTDLDQLGKDLIALSNMGYTKHKILVINYARTFKITEIEKLSKIIKNLPFKVIPFMFKDNDMTELAFLLLCSNDTYLIEDEVEVTMDTIEPLSDEELKRISEVFAKFIGKDVEEILKYYENKDIIDLKKILDEKNK